MKPCKYVQEWSEEVLSFKARQIAQQMYLSRFKWWSLTDNLSTTISNKNYKNHTFRSVFHAYPSYVFSFSFLITLDIYKDYFKGRLNGCNLMQKFHASILWLETYALVHLSLEEVTAFVRNRILWPRNFLIFIVWINWRTLQPTSFLSWCVSHVLGSVHRLVSHILGVMH